MPAGIYSEALGARPPHSRTTVAQPERETRRRRYRASKSIFANEDSPSMCMCALASLSDVYMLSANMQLAVRVFVLVKSVRCAFGENRPYACHVCARYNVHVR